MSETVINQALVSELLRKWEEKTADHEEERSRIPLKTLQVEVLQVARILEGNWKDRKVKGKLRRGLASVAGLGTFSPSTASEIRELQLVVSEVQARYDQLLEDAANAPVVRGNEILSELRAMLSFVLEDGTHEQGAAQLSQLRQIHEMPRSMESLAMALEGFAELAETYKDELGLMEIFSASILDESLQVARDLRERSIRRKSGDLVVEQRETIALRNRLIGAMMDRVTAVRRAVRFVYRDEPDLLEQAASDYERARRSASSDDEDQVDEAIAESEASPEVSEPPAAAPPNAMESPVAALTTAGPSAAAGSR
jgi:hypothetical protein